MLATLYRKSVFETDSVSNQLEIITFGLRTAYFRAFMLDEGDNTLVSMIGGIFEHDNRLRS